MVTSDSSGAGARPVLDDESAGWIRELSGDGALRDEALTRLHDILLRVARRELARRSGQHRITGPELDDLGHQAANDALLAVTNKLAQFRGESRFTTWAYRFVMLEVSTKVARHYWRYPTVAMDVEDWDRLPDRIGVSPEHEAERRDLSAAVRMAVDDELTTHQRQVFVAAVLQGVPLDALAVRLSTTRGALYKTIFDSRRKLRAVLAAKGYLMPAGSAQDPGNTSEVRTS